MLRKEKHSHRREARAVGLRVLHTTAELENFGWLVGRWRDRP